MKWIRLSAVWRRFRTLDIQIDHNRLLSAAHHYRLDRLIRTSVHLLMGNKRGYIDKVARAGFLDKLQTIAPAEAGPPADDVEHGLKLTVMMRAGASRRLHGNRSRPQLIGAGTRVRDGRRPAHTRSLRSIGIQFSRSNDADSILHYLAAFALASFSALIRVSRCLESLSFSVQMYSQRSLSVISGVHCVSFHGRV